MEIEPAFIQDIRLLLRQAYSLPMLRNATHCVAIDLEAKRT